MNRYPNNNNNGGNRNDGYDSGYSYGEGRYGRGDGGFRIDDDMNRRDYGRGDRGNKGGLRGFYYRWPIVSTLILIFLATIVFLLLGLLFANLWTRHGATATVPAVKGMLYDQAVNVLDAADLTAVVSDSIYDDSQPGGTVVEIWPKAGAVVKADREVYLTIVSYSPRMVIIDIPLTDISVKQAENYLASHGITSVRVEYQPGEFDNNVIAAKVGNEYVTLGSRIPANATVVLTVSRSVDPDFDAAIDAAADSILNSEIPEVPANPETGEE